MKSRNNILIIAIALFAFSCNQTEAPSSKVKAESKPETVATTVALETPAEASTPEDKNPEVVDMSYAEKELKEEAEEVIKDDKVKNVAKVKEVDRGKPEDKAEIAEEMPKEPVVTKEIIKEVETKVEAEKEKVVTDKIASVDKEVKEEVPVVKEVVKEVVFSHDAFDQLLRKYVSASGKVNYAGFKKEEAILDTYLEALNKNAPANGWSKSKKMAYWINAYNAATIKLILKNHPVASITKLHGGKPWDHKWIPLGGKTYTLNNIENDILRPVYKDARIHFAVNCAAKSCPPLLNRAWTEGNLNRYLEKQTKSFVNDPKQNTISADAVEVSKIFEWYAVDFDNLIDYLNKYSDTKINPNAKISYKEYNWDLND